MAKKASEHDPRFVLPVVEPEVISSFERHIPELDTMYTQLKNDNPDLAFFVLRRAEQLAPQNTIRKEAYARIAIELATLLANQQIIAGMQSVTDITQLLAAPSAGECDDGEVQPPAV